VGGFKPPLLGFSMSSRTKKHGLRFQIPRDDSKKSTPRLRKQTAGVNDPGCLKQI
jgi:hypothetical protein